MFLYCSLQSNITRLNWVLVHRENVTTSPEMRNITTPFNFGFLFLYLPIGVPAAQRNTDGHRNRN